MEVEGWPEGLLPNSGSACLHRRSDCYRVERSSSRAGLSSRCGPAPFTAHCSRLLTPIDVGALRSRRPFWWRNEYAG